MTIRHILTAALLLTLPAAAVLPALAQESNPPVEQSTPPDPPAPVPQAAPEATPAPPQPLPQQPAPRYQTAPPARGSWQRFDEPDPMERPLLPMNITIPAGTWLNMRINQGLSSDHNKPGDPWTATLVQPVIVDGRVLAHRGQTVGGTVADAEKAGRAKGVSRLALELNDLTLADGRHIPVKARLMEFRGPTSVGRDVAGFGTTVGVGAAIGAAVNGGVGAGIGAAAGVVAGTIGVLLTRGHPTVLLPESQLTFRLEAPFTFAVRTESSLRAFAPVQPDDYQLSRTLRPGVDSRGSAPPAVAYTPYPYAPYPYAYSYPYPYYGYSPYFYGPSIGFYYGGGWGYRGWGGWHGGWGGGHWHR